MTLHEKSALAATIVNRTEGESCQMGMLEFYYQILKVE